MQNKRFQPTFNRLSCLLTGWQDAFCNLVKPHDMCLLHLATGLVEEYCALPAKGIVPGVLTHNYALTGPAVLLSRQHSSSPAPRRASPTPVTVVVSRKQKSSNQGLHRQAVVAQASSANAQQSSSSRPQNSEGCVLLEADGQGSSGVPSQKAAQGVTGSKGIAPERTSSGGMLNPFASTFIPHSNSSGMLSSSATRSQ